MSLSKWLSRDNGPHDRTHLSPLLQHEGEEEDREDSTMTITSTNGLRRASLVRIDSIPPRFPHIAPYGLVSRAWSNFVATHSPVMFEGAGQCPYILQGCH